MSFKKNLSIWNLSELQMNQKKENRAQSQKEIDIIMAAEQLFSEKGHAKTTTAEIAKLANTTERTLFKYFPTKDKLIRHILLPLILKTLMPLQIEKTIKVISKDWETPKDFLKALFKNRLEASFQIGDKMRFLLGEVLQDKKLQVEISDYWQKNVYPEFKKVITKFQKEGKIQENLDPDILSRTLILSIVSQVILFSLFKPEKKETAFKQIDSVVTILLESVT